MTSLAIEASESRTQAEFLDLLGDVISDTFETNHKVENTTAQQQGGVRIDYEGADGIRISSAEMLPLLIHNMGGHLKSRPKRPKYFVYHADQPQTIYTEDKLLHLQPNELIIVRSDTPRKMACRRQYKTSALIVEEELFHEFIPDADSLAGRRLQFPYGIEHILQNMMESILGLLSNPDSQRFTSVTPKLVRSFLEVLALSELRQPHRKQQANCASMEIRREQIREFIKRNYASPDLSVSTIASNLNLSTRYVQMAFCGADVTPSELLRKYRLDACARMLRDPDERYRSITDIAFACGFNSSGHFSCLFKQIFGMTPREYRAANLSE